MVDTNNQSQFQRVFGALKFSSDQSTVRRKRRFKPLLLTLLENYDELGYTSVTHHSKLVKSEYLTALKQDPYHLHSNLM